MAEYLIQGETLEAMADKIRDKLGLTKYSFKEEVGADGVFNSGAVTVYYKEYVDSTNDYDAGLNSDVYANDVFVAYDFIADNNGVITPVIYKTDISGDEPDTPDYSDQHFYVGRAEVDGVLYDKWRRIELEGDLFTWDSMDKKYLYTNILIDNNGISPNDMPDRMDDIYNAGYAANVTGNMPLINAKTQTFSSPTIVYDTSDEYHYVQFTYEPNERAYVEPDSTSITLRTPLYNFGTATAADVASGKTFTSIRGYQVTGTNEGLVPAATVLSGSYIFNGTLDFSSMPVEYQNREHYMHFSINGVQYVGFYFQYVSGASSLRCILYNNGEIEYFSLHHNGVWANDSYRDINFPNPCVTSGIFGNWFGLNAVIGTRVSFLIDNTTYQTKHGWTWAQWCESEYNTQGYYIDGNDVYASGGECYVGDEGAAAVSAHSAIEAYTRYFNVYPDE